jgi:hypothetical protein
LGEVMDMMALINSSVNFILYSLMSTQFRKTLSSIFVKTIQAPIYSMRRSTPRVEVK